MNVQIRIRVTASGYTPTLYTLLVRRFGAAVVVGGVSSTCFLTNSRLVCWGV